MDFKNFTLKAQEVVKESIKIVQISGQQVIEPEHIFKAALKVSDNIVNFLMNKTGANAQNIALAIDRMVAQGPKVRGGEPYFSHMTNEMLLKAETLSK